MLTRSTRPRALAGGLAALLLGSMAAPSALAQRRRRSSPSKIQITQDDIERELEPGRLIFDTSLKRRYLALQSVVKQAMDWKYSQKMVEDIAKVFESPRYKPISVRLQAGEKPFLINPQDDYEEGVEIDVPVDDPSLPVDIPLPEEGREDEVADGSDSRRPPDEPSGIDLTPDTGRGDGGDGPTGRAPPPGTAPDTGPRPPDGMGPGEWDEIARDLENGIHNEILRVMRERGYELGALNVFAQSLDVVKVILIVVTRDLPNSRIRPTLRDVRQIIEREVLQAKYPGVHLAELSSFTILNEQDGHFYEHPVLYWQMKQPGWTGGPATPGRIHGEAPEEGGVSAPGTEFDDYFTSREFVPEEDFDDRQFLEPLDGF